MVNPDGLDFGVMGDAVQIKQIAAAVRVTPVRLSEEDIEALVAFLNTLTDPAAIEGRLGVPASVPSRLPVP